MISPTKQKAETEKVPTVSVLMSVYSEPLEWVKQAIDSILTQTFTDFEFIIINDKPDREELAEFLREEAEKDPRIIIHTNSENIGLTKSLNVGLKLCRGKYIARMDADDISLPERLCKQMKFMDQNPEVIASSALAYEWNGKKITGEIKRPITYQQFKEYIFTSSPFIHPLLLIRKGAMEKLNIAYDESFLVSQDYKLAADLINGGKILNLNEKLLLYRVSNTQISKTKGRYQDENGRRIRRLLINNSYKKFGLKELPTTITYQTIKENYLAAKTHIHKHDKSSWIILNCIRRVLYYSLEKYSFFSALKFIFSRDYFSYPYNARRFVIVLLKHVYKNIVPPLV